MRPGLVAAVTALAACGRLGFDERVVPVDAVDPRCIVQLSAGDDHVCALLGEGSVWCWGRDLVGQLGNGMIADAAYRPARTLDGPYSAIGAGGDHTCGLAADRSVACWGNNNNFQVSPTQIDSATPITTDIVADGLVVRGSHTCAAIGSTARCWGDADGGQLGDGTALDKLAAPTPIGETDVVRLYSGEDHLCAVTSSGLRCWGINSRGQLGVDPASTPSVCQDMAGAMVACSTIPIDVVGLPPIRQVALGRGHSCAVTDDATVYCWGDNVRGALGDGSMTTRSTPAVVPGLLATSVIAGDRFSCALTIAATVTCWGDNGRGELASGDQIIRPSPSPIGLTGVREIAAASAGQVVCARTDDSVYCWGANPWNTAGDTGGTDVVTPRLVMPACP